MKRWTVALAGNPNVGKSTLFNALTGLRQHTGNWPGKTVEVAQGTFRRVGIQIQLVDLPGTYSLSGATEDEVIAAEYIAQNKADCIVVVCDATALERSLILAIQILQRTQSVILCVNLMDEAKRRGFSVDAEKLSACLGVPVALTAAGGRGGARDIIDWLTKLDEIRYAPKIWSDPIAEAKEIASRCVSREKREESWPLVLDRVLVSRRRGIPILLSLLFFVIFLTVWGANYPSAWLEKGFDGGYIWLKSVTASWPWWLSGLLIDGMYSTATRVMAVMLPPLLIFFPLFTLLEDVGYLPRMAILLDGPMQRCGGSGRQALTMCMGLGCNAVGVTGCRIIGCPRERTAAVVTNAMIPCNGRFPTLIMLAGMILPMGIDGLCVGGFVLLGVLGAMAATGLLTKTVPIRENTAFLMELPPFRRPRVTKILIRSLLDRSVYVAGRALAVSAPVGAILWLLANSTAMQILSHWLQPPGLLIGMNGGILLAFLLSAPANELLIPVLLMIMGGNALQMLTLENIICIMIFTVFHWPCTTTVLTVYKETASIKKTAVAVFLPTAVGILLCMIVNLLL